MRHFWLWRLLGLEAVVVAAHWSARKGYFQVEDFLWLHLSGWRSLLDSFGGAWGYASAYRPIVRLSYWLNNLVFGDWAPGWHFVNLAGHGLNAALLALVLERLGSRRAPASVAALLFAVAPLTAETVEWISFRTAIICLCFMLLAALAWLAALRRPGPMPIAALVATALLGAMSYEAGFILPLVLLCLLPFALGRTGAPPMRAFRLLGLVALVLTILFGLRRLLIGMLTTDVDGIYPDFRTAILANAPGAADLFLRKFGAVELSCLALAIAAALAFRRLRLAALAALGLTVLLYLPFLMVASMDDRFFYMAMAPFSVLAVLAANQPQRLVRLSAATLSLALFFPGFLTQTRTEARVFSAAGQRVALLRHNIVQDIPKDDLPNIIDGIPQFLEGRPLFGAYFELAITEAAKPAGPWVIRADYAERNAIVVYDLLNRPTRFWTLDEATQHLAELTKAEWLGRHPEVPALLATISTDGKGLGMAPRSEDCTRADVPAAVDRNEPPAPDIEVSAATATNDGIATLGARVGFGAFVVTARDTGALPRTLAVRVAPSPASLPLGLSICEIEPATGQCRRPAGPLVTARLDGGSSRSFWVFMKACEEIPFDPERNRIVVELAGGASVSVAVRTAPKPAGN